jgi:multidrug resistance protein MdtO
MTVAATTVALICVTFRIPFGYQAATYALLVSHEALENNWLAAFRIAGATVLMTIFTLVSAALFAGSPPLHFLWNAASLFLAFFCISAMRAYAVAVPVAVVIGVAVPTWDRVLPARSGVADTLWLCLGCTVAVFVTAAVSSIFSALAPDDQFTQPLVDRLQLVEEVLRTWAAGIPAPPELRRQISDAVVAGASAWRLALRRSGLPRTDRDRFSAIGALVGRLIDIASGLAIAPPRNLPGAQALTGGMADAVAEIREAVLDRRRPRLSTLDAPPGDAFVLREIVQTISMIADTWTHASDTNYPERNAASEFDILVPDAFTNPDHLKFAFRGCLAAITCYVVYNAVDWPGLSTAINTCLFTALSSVGASRQKQTLRLVGAILGGVVLGIGSQILVFPGIDSSFGYALVFGFVSAISSWIMTATPRLSYLGLQVALAFYVIHLQNFHFETSLTVARDRVLGIVMGLTTMWLIFDHLWSASASESMRRALVRSIRLLAQLTRGPASTRQDEAVQESSALRETIYSTFDQTRALSDGVLFEFGPGRAAALEFCEQVRRLQPQLRSLFVLRISALEYRLGLPGFQLPREALTAQIRFDECEATALEELADRIESGRPGPSSPRRCILAGGIETLEPYNLALLQKIAASTASIAAEIDSWVACGALGGEPTSGRRTLPMD